MDKEVIIAIDFGMPAVVKKDKGVKLRIVDIDKEIYPGGKVNMDYSADEYIHDKGVELDT